VDKENVLHRLRGGVLERYLRRDTLELGTIEFTSTAPEQQKLGAHQQRNHARSRAAHQILRAPANPKGAEIPLDVILDRVTASDPSVTDYVLKQPARWARCWREILENTLVEPA
jgi:hypothetical protein